MKRLEGKLSASLTSSNHFDICLIASGSYNASDRAGKLCFNSWLRFTSAFVSDFSLLVLLCLLSIDLDRHSVSPLSDLMLLSILLPISLLTDSADLSTSKIPFTFFTASYHSLQCLRHITTNEQERLYTLRPSEVENTRNRYNYRSEEGEQVQEE